MPDHVRGKLEQILGKLPVLEGRHDSIAREAEFLWVHASLMAANDLPRANPTGTKQAERELEKLLKLIKPLVLHIDGMGRTSLDAMEEKGIPNRFVLARDLVKLGDAAWRGRKRLRSQPAVTLLGRPRKRRASAVTEAAAEVFKRLTGWPATVVVNSHNTALGPFLDFLKAVFDACGIDASAEAQAKSLKEKTPPKEGT